MGFQSCDTRHLADNGRQIISRLGSDAGIAGDAITREVSDGVQAAFISVVGISMMFYVSAKLTLLVLCLVPPTSIGAVFYGRYIKKLSRKTQSAVGEMVSVAEEKLGAIRTGVLCLGE